MKKRKETTIHILSGSPDVEQICHNDGKTLEQNGGIADVVEVGNDQHLRIEVPGKL